MSQPSIRQVARGALPALLVAALVLVPFLGKAFTIDDTFFLFSARNALVDPLHPSAFEMTWGQVPERASRIAPTGPLMAWLLMPSVAAGGSEVLAHLVSLVFLWLAALATVSLALRQGLTGAWAAWAGVLLVAAPAVIGMAGTAMPDVPAMALGVSGIDRLMAWREGRRARDGLLASLLLGIAPLARTHLVGLLPVGALLMVENPFSLTGWRDTPKTRWVPLMAAPLITALVAFLSADPGASGSSLVETAARLSSSRFLASNVVAFGVHWVLAVPFVVPLMILRWREILRSPWVLAGATLAAVLLLRAAHGDGAPYAFAPLVALTVACLVDVLGDAIRGRDATQLALVSWLLVPFPSVVYAHLPSKYLLAAAPAAAILLSRFAARTPGLGTRALATTAVLGVGLGIAILSADAAAADVGRRAARELIAPQVLQGRRVWYAGNQGFQWYAEAAGARCLSAAPPYPVEGDLVAYRDHLATALRRSALESLPLLGRIEHDRPGGRVMSKLAGAGFYSNAWGYLPWAWGTDIADAVDLWLVVPIPAVTPGLAPMPR